MSRLLFAAARGARIKWMNGTLQPVPYYIHPDDAHLQYGPISTALREMAADDSWNPSTYRVVAVATANEFQSYFSGSRENYPLFYLILAEALADEGL
jgi:hypothetical protein